jgi:hypothetical protein
MSKPTRPTWEGIPETGFLSEMEGPGNENPCPKCGRYHLTECEEDTHE